MVKFKLKVINTTSKTDIKMNYESENEKTRNYYKKDFSKLNELIHRIRAALISGEKIKIEDLSLEDIVDFKPNKNFFYISLFQEYTKRIRFGSRRDTLEATLNRVVEKLRENQKFAEFEISNPDKTRILIEWVTEKELVDINRIHTGKNFDKERFEIGIDGIEIKYNNKSFVWMPTDAVILNEKNLTFVFADLVERMGLIKNKNLELAEKAKLLKNLKNIETYIIKSKAFVTYKNEIIPLYRGNVLYDDFSYNTVINIFKKANDWLIENMNENGQFMYYYNPTLDNNIDHEHPTRREPNLYYNDLRHCGGVISLLRLYELTGDKKYLEPIKKGIDWSIGMTKFHKDEKGREAAFVYANLKAKLGGVGLPLIMLMRYRINTNDETYDRYIEAYSRHLLSRLTEDGEFLGYYIHPSYNNGEPLLTMTNEEKMKTFSFYYPGEALMGLGMVANSYNKNKELVHEIIQKSKKAMRWIIDERPKIYSEMFTALPSDAWLMQAIEEWSNCKDFLEKNDIDFVFNDAKTMMEKMYQKDDSPYIDFEGGMYYNFGDHYYLDGARCEGLIAAYYLAKKLKNYELADKILYSAKKAAKCQFQLWVNELNNYPHQNPKKSCNSIKFKSTRQWSRVDSIQHVACFFIRLYWAECNS